MADLRTFKDLKTLALTYLDQAGDINTGNQGDVLVGNAIAMQQNKRLTSQRWNFMLWGNPVVLTFQTGVRNYTLHPLAGMVTEFQNVTGGQIMNETPSRARYKIGVQDDRFHFEFVQESPVQLPFTSGLLTIVGNATISYVDVNGNPVTESIANGTTSAQVDTVVAVTKNDSTALQVTDAVGKTILSLSASQFSLSYPQIRLMADGVTGEHATYRFYRRPRYLSLDNDIPEIPYPFSHILVYDALLELYTYNDATPPQWWVKQQSDWELQLNQAYQEGEAEGSEVRTVIESDQYEG
jgi:hypothetical protein